ncbi:phosphatidylinositol kinase [Vibrio breoganii]
MLLELQVKMPFAISNKTGNIIGIEQVSRGDNCDCRCLSCNTPVTARQGDVNQWHFSHRTSEISTANECEFSPVTALALIVRQELHSLTHFDLDEWAFSNIEWEIDTLQYGLHCDAYAKDDKTNTSVLIEIPFANGHMNHVEKIPSDIDIVLRVNTQMMADTLYLSKSKYSLYSSKDIYYSLLMHWEKWVSMERWPEEKVNSYNNRINNSDHILKSLENSSVESNSDSKICACCGKLPGSYGKGLLCSSCVRRNVGPTFNSISDMVNHYK